jgi:hypothetical protein
MLTRLNNRRLASFRFVPHACGHDVACSPRNCGFAEMTGEFGSVASLKSLEASVGCRCYRIGLIRQIGPLFNAHLYPRAWI